MRHVVGIVALCGLSTAAITLTVAEVLWDTGLPRYTIFNGAPTYLGFSSGLTSPSTPQRWLAQPFALNEPATITQIDVFGFEVAGSEFDDIVITLWSRDLLADPPTAPIDEDIVAGPLTLSQGSNPLGFFDPDLPVDPTTNPGWRWRWPLNITLPAGAYYLTVRAGTPSTPGGTSNFAWFANAPDGWPYINEGEIPGLVNPAPYPYMFRSATYPSPGFLPFDVAAATYHQDPNFPDDPNVPEELDGQDLSDLYQAAFQLEGTPHEHICCIGDIDGNGAVDLSDLATLLANFGSVGPNLPGDIAPPGGDGAVDLADLAVLLARFGSECPGGEPFRANSWYNFEDVNRLSVNAWCEYYVWRSNNALIPVGTHIYVQAFCIIDETNPQGGFGCEDFNGPIFYDYAYKGAGCNGANTAQGDWAYVRKQPSFNPPVGAWAWGRCP